MASIDEVARLAGVSTATVSRRAERSGPGVRVREGEGAGGGGSRSATSCPRVRRAWPRGRHPQCRGRRAFPRSVCFFSTVLSGVSRTHAGRLRHHAVQHHRRQGCAPTRVRHVPSPQRVDAVIAVSIELDEDETQVPARSRAPSDRRFGGPNPEARHPHGRRRRGGAAGDRASDQPRSQPTRATSARTPEFDIDFHHPDQPATGLREGTGEGPGSPSTTPYLEPADFTVEGGYRAAKATARTAGSTPDRGVSRHPMRWPIGALLAARDLGFSVPE